jgi:hypothetical protein
VTSTIEERVRDAIKMKKALIGLLILALFGPANLVSPWTGTQNMDNIWGVLALTWYVTFMDFELIEYNYTLHPFLLIQIVLLLFLRIVFVIQMSRYYSMKTTKKRTLLLGIASELQSPFITISFAFIMNVILSGDGSFAFYIPIPILLLVGYTIMKMRPLEEDTIPWEESEITPSD